MKSLMEMRRFFLKNTDNLIVYRVLAYFSNIISNKQELFLPVLEMQMVELNPHSMLEEGKA